MPAGEVKTAMEALHTRTVFFGHQSVGHNVLDGAQAVAREAGISPFRIVETRGKQVEPGTIAHAFIGTNTDPDGKMRDFQHALDEGLGDTVQIALMKFCYVDFNAQTDVQALFQRYSAMVSAIESKHPRLRLVHVTVPLSAPTPGLKGWVKRALGRGGSSAQDNRVRHNFSELIRKTYPADRIFDLEALESTDPAGRPHTVDVDGSKVPSLLPDYTDDGGHLNPSAQKYVAERFLTFLSKVSLP